ncbi:MAG: chloramphenicol acetyltransferase [Erysipelotrichaceae bacterium]|nr:chloramphenicol acetyltransferase [Erysipelotrichaceae bacterium]
MTERKIDFESWERKELYNHFLHTEKPFWSVTFRADVTKLRRYAKTHRLPFYFVMVWAVTEAMNRTDAFLYTIREDGIYHLERRYPSFTYLPPGSDLFRIATIDKDVSSPEDFCRAASEITSSQDCFLVESKESDQLIFISCLPWIDVTGLTNEGMTDPSDSIPRIAWGQYQEENGRLMLGMSLEVNHRLIDGLHVGQFYENFGTILEQLPREI